MPGRLYFCTGRRATARPPSPLRAPIYIPYAIDIEGQIMRLYDPLHHQRVQRQLPMNFDPRWVLIKRPFVKAGGELTTSQLSPSFDPLMRYYEAPIHLKANGC